ncbi:MAG: hypothetical protein ACOYM1_11365 [Methylovulum sp.]
MKQVLCVLLNASENINGVAFTLTPQGRVSEPIEDALADSFASIEGYALLEISKAKPKTESV